MTRAWQRWDDVGGFRCPEGWVYRVALNWAISWRRKLRREDMDTAHQPTTFDPMPYPELSEAVDRLPVKLRAVVVGRYLLDWSVETVAEALDIPVGTVKSRTNRALERLARDLKEKEES
jgi:RNA polymerase sigma factor (sigma-70 family)